MTITIKLTTADELQLIQPLMEWLNQSGIKIKTAVRTKKRKEEKIKTPVDMSVLDRLRGSIILPDDFDYKKDLYEAVNEKHK